MSIDLEIRLEESELSALLVSLTGIRPEYLSFINPLDLELLLEKALKDWCSRYDSKIVEFKKREVNHV